MDAMILFPMNYKKITDIVMGTRLEDYGHPVDETSGEEFDMTRGYTMSAFGWKTFCDTVGPFAEPHYVGNIYDAENGWGYVGNMVLCNGKHFPIFHCWAMRKRLEWPGRGRYEIDKIDAIYDYESLDLQ